MSLSVPGHTKEESITMFLEALREPANEKIFQQIENALRKLGISDRQIEHYKMTGRLIKDWDGFEDEMETDFDKEGSDKEYWGMKESKKFVGIVIITSIIVGTIMMGIITAAKILNISDSETSDQPVPAITESAPFKEGDKL